MRLHTPDRGSCRPIHAVNALPRDSGTATANRPPPCCKRHPGLCVEMPRSGGSRASWGGAGALTLNTSAVPPSTAAATPSSAPVFSPLERGAGMSLGLHRAVATGNTALALHALETGQSPQSLLHGVAPLHVAAATGDVLAIQLLLYYGADANVPRHRSRQPGPGVEASTPLHFAAANGQLAAARILLENGARPNATDRDGQTCLLYTSPSPRDRG